MIDIKILTVNYPLSAMRVPLACCQSAAGDNSNKIKDIRRECV